MDRTPEWMTEEVTTGVWFYIFFLVENLNTKFQ